MINSGVYKIIITVILKFWLHFLLWCWKVKFCSPETIAEKLNVEGCKLRVSGGSRIERRLQAANCRHIHHIVAVTPCLCKTLDILSLKFPLIQSKLYIIFTLFSRIFKNILKMFKKKIVQFKQFSSN